MNIKIFGRKIKIYKINLHVLLGRLANANEPIIFYTLLFYYYLFYFYILSFNYLIFLL